MRGRPSRSRMAFTMIVACSMASSSATCVCGVSSSNHSGGYVLLPRLRYRVPGSGQRDRLQIERGEPELRHVAGGIGEIPVQPRAVVVCRRRADRTRFAVRLERRHPRSQASIDWRTGCRSSRVRSYAAQRVAVEFHHWITRGCCARPAAARIPRERPEQHLVDRERRDPERQHGVGPGIGPSASMSIER